MKELKALGSNEAFCVIMGWEMHLSLKINPFISVEQKQLWMFISVYLNQLQELKKENILWKQDWTHSCYSVHLVSSAAGIKWRTISNVVGIQKRGVIKDKRVQATRAMKGIDIIWILLSPAIPGNLIFFLILFRVYVSRVLIPHFTVWFLTYRGFLNPLCCFKVERFLCFIDRGMMKSYLVKLL